MNNVLQDKRPDAISLAERRKRLLNARTPPIAPISKPEMEGAYGVSTEGDDCVISLGPVAPFRIPKTVAIKLAMLILRRCGVEIEHG